MNAMLNPEVLQGSGFCTKHNVKEIIMGAFKAAHNVQSNMLQKQTKNMILKFRSRYVKNTLQVQ